MTKVKIIIALIVIAAAGLVIDASAGRCDELCTPAKNQTCGLAYGDDGAPTACGGYKGLDKLPSLPIE